MEEEQEFTLFKKTHTYTYTEMNVYKSSFQFTDFKCIQNNSHHIYMTFVILYGMFSMNLNGYANRIYFRFFFFSLLCGNYISLCMYSHVCIYVN